MAPPTDPVVAKPLRGGLCIGFGALGVLVGCAALIAVWIYGHRASQMADQTVTQLEHRVFEFTAAAGDAQAGVTLTREIVGKIEVELRNRVREALVPGPDVQARLRTLSQNLDQGIGRLQVWLGRADQVLGLAEDVVKTLEAQGLWTAGRPDAISDVLSAMDEARTMLTRLESDVLRVHGVLDDLSRGVLPEREESELTQLSERIDRSLVDLSGIASRFQASADRLVDSLRSYQKVFEQKLLLIQVIVSVLVLWQIVGQWCLFLAGKGLYNPLKQFR